MQTTPPKPQQTRDGVSRAASGSGASGQVSDSGSGASSFTLCGLAEYPNGPKGRIDSGHSAGASRPLSAITLGAMGGCESPGSCESLKGTGAPGMSNSYSIMRESLGPSPARRC